MYAFTTATACTCIMIRSILDEENRMEIITLITLLDVSGLRRCTDVSCLTAVIILLLQQVPLNMLCGKIQNFRL